MTPIAADPGDAINQLQRQLDALRSELEQSRQLSVLGVLASMIAHEINNLMTPVMSYAHLALRKPEDAALTRRALERAAAGASHASQIADSILSVAKDAVTTVAGGRRSTDVKAAVAEALDHIAEDLSRGSISIRLEIAAGLVAAVRPIVVQQIVLNLVLNARRALNTSGGVVRIAAQETPCSTGNAPGWVKLTVADSGPGIPPEVAGALFQPFVRRDAGTPGTGLGLAICRRLVETVGGRIEAKSSPEHGTEFTILLPSAG